jgi:hypothetical protein
VLIFEIVSGFSPFKKCGGDQRNLLLKRIVDGKVRVVSAHKLPFVCCCEWCRLIYPAVTDTTLSAEIVRDGCVCCEQSTVCASFHLHDPTLPCCMCTHTRCAAADLTLSSSSSISLFPRASLLQSHLNEQVRYPRKFSPDLRSLLGGLLSKDTSVRKQCATSMATHPWFARTDWAAVAAKQLIPPTIPRGPFRHQGKR